MRAVEMNALHRRVSRLASSAQILRALLREHDARIQDAAKINPFRLAAAQPRVENLPAHLRELLVVQEWYGRKRAHAARVQAPVAIQRPFVVLGWRKEFEPLSVTESMESNLGPFQKLL